MKSSKEGPAASFSEKPFGSPEAVASDLLVVRLLELEQRRRAEDEATRCILLGRQGRR